MMTSNNEPTVLTDEPCSCPECDNGVQPGHFACEQPHEETLQAERAGRVFRAYDDGQWQWFAA